MGAPHSRPEDRVNHINRELSSIRNSLRISRSNLTEEKRNSIVKSLADQSTEVKSLSGRVKQKKINETLKKIGDTMQEVLSEDKNNLQTVDSEFVNKRSASTNSSARSNKSAKPKKGLSALEKQKRQSIPTLMDIEVKFFDLRPKIDSAVRNQDTSLLRFYQQTLKTIASDMEMIETIHDTPMDDLKNKLSKQLTSQYQKISKALKEIRRNDNLQYLTKQTRKAEAQQNLNSIELQLAQTESLMDKMTKDKNEVDFSIIRNNLVKINEKLKNVDCVDDDIKDKTVSLTQKFKEIVKNNETVMAKIDFDQNFSETVQKLELLINTFNADTDKNHFLHNLEHVRQCAEKLEEFNESTKTKKKNLTDEINKHIREIKSYLRHSYQSADGQTVQQIVEDSVELRKKVKSSDREHTVIDQFYNYWTNVKNNFNINSYSNISLLRLDNVLEEMQTSIMDIRENIADKCDLKSNLDRIQSQSMPRLTLNKHNSAYGSQKSLNQINEENKIIKTKVKLYHISSPELLNAQREYLDEKHENKRFSKIEEIKTQVYYIKEKVNEHHNKNLLRDKLEHYLKTLNGFLRDSNKIVANNANIVAKDIHELIHKLYLADIKENIDILSKRAENFYGNKFDKDFDEIRENLIKLQVNLENISIPVQYEQLEKDKNEMLDAIFYHIQSLESKVVYYQTNDENVKKIHTRLTRAKEQIKTFTGVYKGTLYNAIERDLNKILMDLECIEDKSVASEVTQDVEKYLKILEVKANTDENIKDIKSIEIKPLPKVPSTANLKDDLINIRTEIDRTSDNNQNALEGLKSRLDLVNLELGQIPTRSNENLLKEKDIFTNEVETLRNVVEAKITLGQQPSLPYWPEPKTNGLDVKKTDVTKEMENIYKKFENIKHQVSKGSNSVEYEKVFNSLQELLNELDKFRFMRNTDLEFQKLKLFNEIVYLKDELEKNYKEEQTLKKAERTLGQIEKAINSNKLVDATKMTDDIQSVQKRLSSLKYNHSLKDRKISCEVKSAELVHQIKNLEGKLKHEKLSEIEGVKSSLNRVEEKLNSLKKEISNFVGLKTENKFYILDDTITRLIIELDRLTDTDDTLRKRKISLLKELHQQGNVLEDRVNQTSDILELEQNLEQVSIKTKNFSGATEDYMEIKKLMEDLGRKVHSVRTNSDLVLRKNACVEKYSVLFNKVLAMGNSLRANAIKSETSKITTSEVNHYSEKTEIRKGITTQVFNFVDKPTIKESLDQIEKEIVSCTPKIDYFCNVQHSLEFQSIDDVLTNCTMKLNKIDVPKNSDMDKKKFELMQLLEDYSVLLDKKADDAETIAQIEVTLQSIDDQMKLTLTHDIVERIDESLIEMQVKLGKIDNKQLKPRKDACMVSIILYAGQINEFKQRVKTTAV